MQYRIFTDGIQFLKGYTEIAFYNTVLQGFTNFISYLISAEE